MRPLLVLLLSKAVIGNFVHKTSYCCQPAFVAAESGNYTKKADGKLSNCKIFALSGFFSGTRRGTKKPDPFLESSE